MKNTYPEDTKLLLTKGYLFFVLFDGICALNISGKERLLPEITREIRNFSKIIISELSFVSNNFVSEGMCVFRYRRVSSRICPPLSRAEGWANSGGCPTIPEKHIPWGHKIIPGRIYIHPPPPPVRPFLAMRHFSGEGGGGAYFEAPRGRNFIPPPLLYTPHPKEGLFRGGGVGVYKI